MKSNNVIKRFGLVSFCLAIAISAFSGIAKTNNGVALAEETIQTTDLVHTQAAVTQDETGLRISSDNPYSATFKTVFSGNTTLNFRFAETAEGTYGPLYGDFKIRVTDVTDDSNYFVLQYYVSRTHSSKAQNIWTGLIMQYGDEIRTTSTDNTTTQSWYNYKPMGIEETNNKKSFAPHFLNCGQKTTRTGTLTFTWSDDVLTIKTNNGVTSSATTMNTLAAFDGTYDPNAAKNGFVSKTSWGLPKISFPEGYTISVSSDFTSTNTTDRGSDVLFTSIATGGTTYDLKTASQLAIDSNMQAFGNKFAALSEKDIPTQPAGKVFVGWKDKSSGSIYPAFSIMQAGSYEPYVIDYDTVNGASVRIAGKSGIRFQTMFDAEQYETLKAAGYIQSFGTLITYTDTLTTVGKDFTIENYQDQDTFAKVENTKGVFDYTAKNSKTYKAYTVVSVITLW